MRPQRSVANGIRKRASNEAARARPEIEDRAQTRIYVKRAKSARRSRAFGVRSSSTRARRAWSNLSAPWTRSRRPLR